MEPTQAATTDAIIPAKSPEQPLDAPTRGPGVVISCRFSIAMRQQPAREEPQKNGSVFTHVYLFLVHYTKRYTGAAGNRPGFGRPNVGALNACLRKSLEFDG